MTIQIEVKFLKYEKNNTADSSTEDVEIVDEIDNFLSRNIFNFFQCRQEGLNLLYVYFDRGCIKFLLFYFICL